MVGEVGKGVMANILPQQMQQVSILSTANQVQ